MPLLSDIVTLTPEQHLLVSSLRVCLSASSNSAPKDAIANHTTVNDGNDGSATDWNAFWREVNHHDLQPLLLHAIQCEYIQNVPPQYVRQVKAIRQAIAIKNTHLTQTLLAVLQKLEFHGINVMPFKGPILALQVYQSLAQRRFCDLDLLVDQTDFERTKEIFIKAGYVLNIDEEWSAHLIHPQTNINIDLHHQITESYFPTTLNFRHLFHRSCPYHYVGHAIQILSPEDTFVFLGIQLAKDAHHQQKFLKKAYDLALLITRINFSWEDAIAYSKSMNGKRLVLFSLYIVHQILSVELPDWITQKIKNDRILVAYGQSVCQRLFTEETFQRGGQGMLLRVLFLLEKPFDFNEHKKNLFQHFLVATAAKLNPQNR